MNAIMYKAYVVSLEHHIERDSHPHYHGTIHYMLSFMNTLHAHKMDINLTYKLTTHISEDKFYQQLHESYRNTEPIVVTIGFLK